MTKKQAVAMETATQALRETLAAQGQTLYTVSRKRTGLRTYLSVLVIEDDQPRYLTHSIAEALGKKCPSVHGYDTICMEGNWDMGAELVEQINKAVFRDQPHHLRHAWL